MPELEIKELGFTNNVSASIDLETGPISKICLRCSTHSLSSFRGNVKTITIERAEALIERALDEVKEQAAN